jgi:alginate O-acetyltransferase complex protein AlgI
MIMLSSLFFPGVQLALLKFGLRAPVLTILFWGLLASVTFVLLTAEGINDRYRRAGVWILWLGVLAALRLGGTLALTRHMPQWPRAQTALAFVAVGMSYMALRAISLAEDAANGKVRTLTFCQFIAYLFFVPAFLAGPIDRYPRFAGDLEKKFTLTSESTLRAVMRILWGGFKKVVVVGLLSYWALSADLSKLPVSPRKLWIALYAYSWLLYIDFSAYSDLAIGTGRLFGITLPENFRWPYLRRNIIEFWNHWHASLSSWLRDYLFFPVGQRLLRTGGEVLHPLIIAGATYLFTMAFCGVWHGFAGHFLVWGLYHGCGLWICRAWKVWAARLIAPRYLEYWNQSPLGYCVSAGINFHFVTFGWLFFVFDTRMALHLLKQMWLG